MYYKPETLFTLFHWDKTQWPPPWCSIIASILRLRKQTASKCQVQTHTPSSLVAELGGQEQRSESHPCAWPLQEHGPATPLGLGLLIYDRALIVAPCIQAKWVNIPLLGGLMWGLVLGTSKSLKVPLCSLTHISNHHIVDPSKSFLSLHSRASLPSLVCPRPSLPGANT